MTDRDVEILIQIVHLETYKPSTLREQYRLMRQLAMSVARQDDPPHWKRLVWSWARAKEKELRDSFTSDA